jgi:hypothetical protein
MIILFITIFIIVSIIVTIYFINKKSKKKINNYSIIKSNQPKNNLTNPSMLKYSNKINTNIKNEKNVNLKDEIDQEKTDQEKTDQEETDQEETDQEKTDQEKTDQEETDQITKDKADKKAKTDKKAKADKKAETDKKAKDDKAKSNKKAKDDKAKSNKKAKADKANADKTKADKSKADKSKADKAKADKSKADKAKADKAAANAKADKAKADKAKADKAKADKAKAAANAKAKKAKADKAKADKAKADKAKKAKAADKAKADKAKAKKTKAKKAKADKAKADKAKADKEKGDKEKADKAKVDKAKVDKAKADKAKADKAKADKAKADKAKADKEKADKAKADKADKAKADKSKADKAKADKAKADKAKADKAKADKAKADKAKADKVKADKAKAKKAKAKKAKANKAKADKAKADKAKAEKKILDDCFRLLDEKKFKKFKNDNCNKNKDVNLIKKYKILKCLDHKNIKSFENDKNNCLTLDEKTIKKYNAIKSICNKFNKIKFEENKCDKSKDVNLIKKYKILKCKDHKNIKSFETDSNNCLTLDQTTKDKFNKLKSICKKLSIIKFEKAKCHESKDSELKLQYKILKCLQHINLKSFNDDKNNCLTLDKKTIDKHKILKCLNYNNIFSFENDNNNCINLNKATINKYNSLKSNCNLLNKKKFEENKCNKSKDIGLIKKYKILNCLEHKDISSFENDNNNCIKLDTKTTQKYKKFKDNCSKIFNKDNTKNFEDEKCHLSSNNEITKLYDRNIKLKNIKKIRKCKNLKKLYEFENNNCEKIDKKIVKDNYELLKNNCKSDIKKFEINECSKSKLFKNAHSKLKDDCLKLWTDKDYLKFQEKKCHLSENQNILKNLNNFKKLCNGYKINVFESNNCDKILSLKTKHSNLKSDCNNSWDPANVSEYENNKCNLSTDPSVTINYNNFKTECNSKDNVKDFEDKNCHKSLDTKLVNSYGKFKKNCSNLWTKNDINKYESDKCNLSSDKTLNSNYKLFKDSCKSKTEIKLFEDNKCNESLDTGLKNIYNDFKTNCSNLWDTSDISNFENKKCDKSINKDFKSKYNNFINNCKSYNNIKLFEDNKCNLTSDTNITSKYQKFKKSCSDIWDPNNVINFENSKCNLSIDPTLKNNYSTYVNQCSKKNNIKEFESNACQKSSNKLLTKKYKNFTDDCINLIGKGDENNFKLKKCNDSSNSIILKDYNVFIKNKSKIEKCLKYTWDQLDQFNSDGCKDINDSTRNKFTELTNDKNSRKCDYFTCPINEMYKKDSYNNFCLNNDPCTKEECCNYNPVCSSYTTCSNGMGVLNKNKRCKNKDCSSEECCSYLPLCSVQFPTDLCPFKKIDTEKKDAFELETDSEEIMDSVDNIIFFDNFDDTDLDNFFDISNADLVRLDSLLNDELAELNLDDTSDDTSEQSLDDLLAEGFSVETEEKYCTEKMCSFNDCCHSLCKDNEYYDKDNIINPSCKIPRICKKDSTHSEPKKFNNRECKCIRPDQKIMKGYSFTNNVENNLMQSQFDASNVSCANGYTGIPIVKPCDESGGKYKIKGCRIKCTPLEYYDSNEKKCKLLTVCQEDEMETQGPLYDKNTDDFVSNRKCKKFICRYDQIKQLTPTKKCINRCNDDEYFLKFTDKLPEFDDYILEEKIPNMHRGGDCQGGRYGCDEEIKSNILPPKFMPNKSQGIKGSLPNSFIVEACKNECTGPPHYKLCSIKCKNEFSNKSEKNECIKKCIGIDDDSLRKRANAICKNWWGPKDKEGNYGMYTLSNCVKQYLRSEKKKVDNMHMFKNDFDESTCNVCTNIPGNEIKGNKYIYYPEFDRFSPSYQNRLSCTQYKALNEYELMKKLNNIQPGLKNEQCVDNQIIKDINICKNFAKNNDGYKWKGSENDPNKPPGCYFKNFNYNKKGLFNWVTYNNNLSSTINSIENDNTMLCRKKYTGKSIKDLQPYGQLSSKYHGDKVTYNCSLNYKEPIYEKEQKEIVESDKRNQDGSIRIKLVTTNVLKETRDIKGFCKSKRNEFIINGNQKISLHDSGGLKYLDSTIEKCNNLNGNFLNKDNSCIIPYNKDDCKDLEKDLGVTFSKKIWNYNNKTKKYELNYPGNEKISLSEIDIERASLEDTRKAIKIFKSICDSSDDCKGIVYDPENLKLKGIYWVDDYISKKPLKDEYTNSFNTLKTGYYKKKKFFDLNYIKEVSSGKQNLSVSSQLCKKYADSKSEYTWYGNPDTWTDRPSGCVVHTNQVFYNKSKNDINCGYGTFKCIQNEITKNKIDDVICKKRNEFTWDGASCFGKNEYADQLCDNKRWRGVAISKNEGIKYKDCLKRSFKTGESCSKSNFRGCLKHQKLVRRGDLPSYCENICNSDEFLENGKCVKYNNNLYCNRTQKCQQGDYFSDNKCVNYCYHPSKEKELKDRLKNWEKTKFSNSFYNPHTKKNELVWGWNNKKTNEFKYFKDINPGNKTSLYASTNADTMAYRCIDTAESLDKTGNLNILSKSKGFDQTKILYKCSKSNNSVCDNSNDKYPTKKYTKHLIPTTKICSNPVGSRRLIFKKYLLRYINLKQISKDVFDYLIEKTAIMPLNRIKFFVKFLENNLLRKNDKCRKVSKGYVLPVDGEVSFNLKHWVSFPLKKGTIIQIPIYFCPKNKNFLKRILTKEYIDKALKKFGSFVSYFRHNTNYINKRYKCKFKPYYNTDIFEATDNDIDNEKFVRCRNHPGSCDRSGNKLTQKQINYYDRTNDISNRDFYYSWKVCNKKTLEKYKELYNFHFSKNPCRNLQRRAKLDCKRKVRFIKMMNNPIENKMMMESIKKKFPNASYVDKIPITDGYCDKTRFPNYNHDKCCNYPADPKKCKFPEIMKSLNIAKEIRNQNNLMQSDKSLKPSKIYSTKIYTFSQEMPPLYDPFIDKNSKGENTGYCMTENKMFANYGLAVPDQINSEILLETNDYSIGESTFKCNTNCEGIKECRTKCNLNNDNAYSCYVKEKSNCNKKMDKNGNYLSEEACRHYDPKKSYTSRSCYFSNDCIEPCNKNGWCYVSKDSKCQKTENSEGRWISKKACEVPESSPDYLSPVNRDINEEMYFQFKTPTLWQDYDHINKDNTFKNCSNKMYEFSKSEKNCNKYYPLEGDCKKKFINDNPECKDLDEKLLFQREKCHFFYNNPKRSDSSRYRKMGWYLNENKNKICPKKSKKSEQKQLISSSVTPNSKPAAMEGKELAAMEGKELAAMEGKELAAMEGKELAAMEEEEMKRRLN